MKRTMALLNRTMVEWRDLLKTVAADRTLVVVYVAEERMLYVFLLRVVNAV